MAAQLLGTRFVDRYIPGYLFFKDGIETGSHARWIGHSLQVFIDKDRCLRSERRF